jgi:peptidoglycan/LPS O-acetylase OafA/YrhL
MQTLNRQPIILNSLTGIRGVFAVWVLFFHILVGLEISNVDLHVWLPEWMLQVLHAGGWAVDGFFILSGFILSHVYGETLAEGKSIRLALSFLGHRLARIYPVHLVIIGAYAIAKISGITFAVESCGNPFQPTVCDRFAMGALLEQLLLVSSWHWNPGGTWNIVAWSISSEWFVYLCFSGLILLTAKLRGAVVPAVLIVLAFSAMLFTLYMADLGPAFGQYNEDFGLIRVSGGFICGMLLYRVFFSDAYVKLPWQWIGPLSILVMIIGFNSHWSWLTPFFLATLLLSIAQTRGPLSRVLATRPILWLGNISYSLYMSHLLVMELVGVVFKDPEAVPLSQMSGVQVLGTSVFLVSMSIFVGAVVYYAIEVPSRNGLRKVFSS